MTTLNNEFDMRAAIDMDVILEPDGLVSMDTLRQFIEIMCKSVEMASLQMLDSAIIDELGIPKEKIEEIKFFIADTSRDSLWLASVEPGSIKLKGIMGGILLFLAGALSTGIINRSEYADAIMDKGAKILDQSINLTIEHSKIAIETISATGEEVIDIIIEKTKDNSKVVVRIIPVDRQRDFRRFL